MPLITRLMLQNFKKFPELGLRFTHDRNILVGENESGKSTILLALDLVLSDSRRWVWNRSCPRQQSGIFRKVSAAPGCYPC
jgi:predicted ATP-dependent endonuclease of OLD family